MLFAPRRLCDSCRFMPSGSSSAFVLSQCRSTLEITCELVHLEFEGTPDRGGPEDGNDKWRPNLARPQPWGLLGVLRLQQLLGSPRRPADSRRRPWLELRLAWGCLHRSASWRCRDAADGRSKKAASGMMPSPIRRIGRVPLPVANGWNVTRAVSWHVDFPGT
jgi:hypothetical protein